MTAPKTLSVTIPPVEGKVTAASLTAVVAGLVVATLDRYVVKSNALDGLLVPGASTLVVGAASFVAGFVKKHTPRPELESAESLVSRVLADPDATRRVVDAVNSGSVAVLRAEGLAS